jgi:hypothetical protein
MQFSWGPFEISIYHINLNEFEQRIKKLVLHVCMYKNSNAHARACMHFQKKLPSFHTDYHPGKFRIDPSSSFWEHSRTKNGKIDWLFRSRIFHLYGDVTIAGEGLQNSGLCSALMDFEQGGIFIVPHLLWHGASVFPVSSEGPPHLVASYDTGSILTRILTGRKKNEKE